DAQGTPHTLMILQGYLGNQGAAWQWTQNTLERAIRDELAGGLSEQEHQYAALVEVQAFGLMLGRRLGEMHGVLSLPADTPALGAAQSNEQDCAEWARSIAAQVNDALDAAAQRREALTGTARKAADGLAGQRDALLREIE